MPSEQADNVVDDSTPPAARPHPVLDQAEQPQDDTCTGWVILELMGHRVLAGWLSEQTIAGVAFLRIDVPTDGDVPEGTQIYAPSAVYCITPTTEDTARRMARGRRPAPVARWELEEAKPEEVDVFQGRDPDEPPW
jgi:hypothetical protein